MGSQVVGSFISGILFTNEGSPYWYVVIMTTILSLSTLFLFYLRLPKVAEANYLRERTDSVIVSALPKHETASNIEDNDGAERILDSQNPQEHAPLGIKQVAVSMWNLFWKPRFLLLVP